AGGSNGGPSHPAAMIASNSARSNSSSPQTSSRNCSSTARAGPVGFGCMSRTLASGVDGLPVLALAADHDLAGLGLLSDRDPQRQHAAVVAGGDVLGVQVVAQDQLPAEHAAGPFSGKHLRLAVAGRALGLHGDDVA